MPAILPLSREEAEKYAGQWVAIKGDKVIAATPSGEELIRRVREEKLAVDLVVRIPATNEPQTWIF